MNVLSELCAHCRNWFESEKVMDSYVINNGEINLSKMDVHDGQYIRIVGSVFNDGVYKYPTTELKDETFIGSVWLLKIPPEFLELVEEITKWNQTYGSAVDSPYTSESFGGYSYTKASGANGNAVSWKDSFRSRLNRWRKL